MINFEESVKEIPNLFTSSHVHMIYGLIRWLKPRKIVEIGAYCGYSTCHIAKAMKDTGLKADSMLYVIDNFSLHGVTPAQISNALTHVGVNDVPMFILPLDSQKMDNWPTDIDMAIIDGDHSYEGVLNDFTNCVINGAHIVVIHDSVEWWGPRQLIDEIKRINACLEMRPVLPSNIPSAELVGNITPEKATLFSDWQVIEGYHDSGLAVLIRREDKKPIRYEKGKDVNEKTN